MKIVKNTDSEPAKKSAKLYFEDRGLKKSGPVHELTLDKYPKLYKYVVMNIKAIQDHYNQWLKDPKKIVFPYLVVKEEFFNELEKEYKPQQRCFHICYDNPKKVITRIMGVGYMNEEMMELHLNKKFHGKKSKPNRKIIKKKHGNPLMAIIKKK